MPTPEKLRALGETASGASNRPVGWTLVCGRWLVVAVALVTGGAALAQAQGNFYPAPVPEEKSCGRFWGSWAGPYDYRNPPDRSVTSAVLSQIEALHFGPEIERLEGDLANNNVGPQIEHVLLVYPNHHRALNSLARFAQRKRSENQRIHYFTVSCLFVRAVVFAPDDARVRAVHGVHLSNFGKKREALTELLMAEQLGANDANTLYNIGLLQFDARDFEKSLAYAKRAYAAGFPLPGLRNKLQAAGKWQE